MPCTACDGAEESATSGDQHGTSRSEVRLTNHLGSRTGIQSLRKGKGREVNSCAHKETNRQFKDFLPDNNLLEISIESSKSTTVRSLNHSATCEARGRGAVIQCAKPCFDYISDRQSNATII